MTLHRKIYRNCDCLKYMINFTNELQQSNMPHLPFLYKYYELFGYDDTCFPELYSDMMQISIMNPVLKEDIKHTGPS